MSARHLRYFVLASKKNLDFGKKNEGQTKNKATLAVPQNMRTKCLRQDIRTN